MPQSAAAAAAEELEQVPASGKVFACNICYDAVSEPVVTQCGHLYCWPCLYKWLEPGLLTGERHHLTGLLEETMRPVDESHRHCPACRLPVSVTTIVPIYAIVEDVKEKRIVVKQEEQEGGEILPDEPKSLGLSSSDDANAADSGEELMGTPESSLVVETVSEEEEEEEEEDRKPAARPSDTIDQEDEEENLAAMAYTAASHEDDQPRVPFAAMPSQEEEATPSPLQDTGLRQRSVPRRPAAMAPATRPVEESNVLTRPDIGRYPSVTPRTASIGQVLLLTLQQMLVRLDQSQRDQTRNPGIPPLHETNGHRRNNNFLHQAAERDETTEFLSRVLLMLGSFVILCLLLF